MIVLSKTLKNCAVLVISAVLFVGNSMAKHAELEAEETAKLILKQQVPSSQVDEVTFTGATKQAFIIRREKLEAQLQHWQKTLKKAKASSGYKRNKSRKMQHFFNRVRALQAELVTLDKRQKRQLDYMDVDYFPPEIWITIFDHLNAKDLPSTSLVCKWFYELCSTDLLWESHLKKLPGLLPENPKSELTPKDRGLKHLILTNLSILILNNKYEKVSRLLEAKKDFVGIKDLKRLSLAPVSRGMNSLLADYG